MDRKGQGALEYLLLIGGAVLVAAIVIALITGIPGTDATDAACAAACSARTGPSQMDAVAGTTCTTGIPTGCTNLCTWNATSKVCYAG